MTEMQQILGGMDELNERAQQAAASATEAERRQLVRTGSSFYSWSGRFVGGALAEIYEYVEEHHNDSATRHRFLMLDWVETFPLSCITC